MGLLKTRTPSLRAAPVPLFKRGIGPTAGCTEVDCSDASEKSWSFASRARSRGSCRASRTHESSRVRGSAASDRAREHAFQHLEFEEQEPSDELSELDLAFH